MSQPKLTHVLAFAALALSLLSGPRKSGAEELVYAISRDEFYTVDADGGQIERIATTDTGSRSFHQLAFDTSGRLHGIAEAPTVLSVFKGIELYSFDLKTGHATLEVELETGRPGTGMAFDSRGELWVALGRDLISRRHSGADFELRTTVERFVTSLAVREGQVFATTWDEATGVHRIERLDLASLRLLPLSTFDPGFFFPRDATFDSEGRLRVAASTLQTVVFLLVTDLSTGDFVETFRHTRSPPGDPLFDLRQIASPGSVPPGPEDIPSLDGAGLVIFAGLLLAFAARGLRSVRGARRSD